MAVVKRKTVLTRKTTIGELVRRAKTQGLPEATVVEQMDRERENDCHQGTKEDNRIDRYLSFLVFMSLYDQALPREYYKHL